MVCEGFGLTKNLDRVVEIGGVVALGAHGNDVGVFALVAHVEVIVVPEEFGRGLLFGAGLELPGENELDGGCHGPGFVVQLAIDDDPRRRALDFVARDGRLRQDRRGEHETGQQDSHGEGWRLRFGLGVGAIQQRAHVGEAVGRLRVVAAHQSGE